jgi:hypothetical protein
MQGFIVFDYAQEYPAGLAQLAQWLREGKLKRKETIIKGGVASAEDAFQQLFKGGNIGKSQKWREAKQTDRTQLTREQVNSWSKSRTRRRCRGCRGHVAIECMVAV